MHPIFTSCDILNLTEDTQDAVDEREWTPSLTELELWSKCLHSPETRALLYELLKGRSDSCNEDVSIGFEEVISETEERSAFEVNDWWLTPSQVHLKGIIDYFYWEGVEGEGLSWRK